MENRMRKKIMFGIVVMFMVLFSLNVYADYDSRIDGLKSDIQNIIDEGVDDDNRAELEYFEDELNRLEQSGRVAIGFGFEKVLWQNSETSEKVYEIISDIAKQEIDEYLANPSHFSVLEISLQRNFLFMTTNYNPQRELVFESAKILLMNGNDVIKRYLVDQINSNQVELSPDLKKALLDFANGKITPLQLQEIQSTMTSVSDESPSISQPQQSLTIQFTTEEYEQAVYFGVTPDFYRKFKQKNIQTVSINQAYLLYKNNLWDWDSPPKIEGNKIIKTFNGEPLKDTEGKKIVSGYFFKIGSGENDYTVFNVEENENKDFNDYYKLFINEEGYVMRDGKLSNSERFVTDASGKQFDRLVTMDNSLPFGFPVYSYETPTGEKHFFKIDSDGNKEYLDELSRFVTGDDEFKAKLEELKSDTTQQAKLIQNREIWQSYIGSLFRPLSGIQKSFWDKVLLEIGYTEKANQIITDWMGWTPSHWAIWLCSNIVNEGLPDDVKIGTDRTGNKVITMRLQGSREQTVDEKTLYDISWLIAPAQNDIVYDICFNSCGNCVHVGNDNEGVVVEESDSSSGNFIDYVDEDYDSVAICFRESDGEEQSFRQPIVGEGFIPEDVAQIYANQLVGIGNLSGTNNTNN